MTKQEKQHALEDTVDQHFDSLQRFLDRVIASDDKKCLLDLIGIFNEALVSQLANYGYIDLERVHPEEVENAN